MTTKCINQPATTVPQKLLPPALRLASRGSTPTRWCAANARVLHVIRRWVRVHLLPQDMHLFVPSGLGLAFLRCLFRRTERLRRLGYRTHWLSETPLTPTWAAYQMLYQPIDRPLKKRTQQRAKPTNATKRNGRCCAPRPVVVSSALRCRYLSRYTPKTNMKGIV